MVRGPFPCVRSKLLYITPYRSIGHVIKQWIHFFKCVFWLKQHPNVDLFCFFWNITQIQSILGENFDINVEGLEFLSSSIITGTCIFQTTNYNKFGNSYAVKSYVDNNPQCTHNCFTMEEPECKETDKQIAEYYCNQVFDLNGKLKVKWGTCSEVKVY